MIYLASPHSDVDRNIMYNRFYEACVAAGKLMAAGEIVFSPFAGIGSEGYVALTQGRRFIGMELKRSYYEQACRNLTEAERQQNPLFSEEINEELLSAEEISQ